MKQDWKGGHEINGISFDEEEEDFSVSQLSFSHPLTINMTLREDNFIVFCLEVFDSFFFSKSGTVCGCFTFPALS
jgi:hypothetical protein